MASHCQDCTACCTVFEVKPLGKEFGVPCRHLGPTLFGTGCTIYSDRPQPCKHYVCLWLESQRRPIAQDVMPEHLRPDVCKVVMGWPWGEDRDALYVYPLPGHQWAWMKNPVADHLRMILSRGGKIIVRMGEKQLVMKGDVALFGTEEEFASLG